MHPSTARCTSSAADISSLCIPSRLLSLLVNRQPHCLSTILLSATYTYPSLHSKVSSSTLNFCMLACTSQNYFVKKETDDSAVAHTLLFCLCFYGKEDGKPQYIADEVCWLTVAPPPPRTHSFWTTTPVVHGYTGMHACMYARLASVIFSICSTVYAQCVQFNPRICALAALHNDRRA